jgi:hypothetical protein
MIFQVRHGGLQTFSGPWWYVTWFKNTPPVTGEFRWNQGNLDGLGVGGVFFRNPIG